MIKLLERAGELLLERFVPRIEAQAGETWRERCECRYDSAGIGYLWVRDCRYAPGSGEKRCGPCYNNITRC
ncbi:hypothetical protein [Allokutzneria sp. NRRL B-24872]|uniref:hypothetical protein n=1 Tax=Allokutzneria sp. NRRL B-24872 TaxID=1137961 RepID=UPI000A36D548|nr:hypothetical protein [Allokutzneria sp. NRRL B-24872]